MTHSYLFLLFIFQFSVSGILGQGPTKDDLEKTYENSKIGEELCVYSGSFCKRGEQFCSSKTRTCEGIFPSSIITEEQKIDFCKEVIDKNNTLQGRYDGCVYYLTISTYKATWNLTLNKSNSQNLNPPRSLGIDFCPYNNTVCQLGQEFCNSVTGKCEPLFDADTSDIDKWSYCHDVVRGNLSAQYYSCIYAIGLLSYKYATWNLTLNKSNSQNLNPPRSLGIDFCPYNNTVCQLGQEFCNSVTGKCEPLFEADTSDIDKWSYCHDVVRGNLSAQYYSCIYAIGLLSYKYEIPLIAATTPQVATGSDNSLNLGLDIGIPLAILGIAAIAVLVVLWRKKLACFKQNVTETSDLQNRRKLSDENTKNRQEEVLMNRLIQNEIDEVIEMEDRD